MIGILWGGQSLGRAMSDLQTGGCPTPHADTHVWDGTAFATPTGDGMVTYLNALRAVMGQPVYCINACVNGQGLDPWIASLAAASITTAQTAIATVPGLAIDRIEFWGMQSDGLGSATYQHCRDGLDTLLGIYAAGLPDARFCVWPVGRLSGGTSEGVVQAQMDFAFIDPATREIGPASHDQATADGTHLAGGGQYAVMGVRGAVNAKSYFDAKTAGTLATPHGGAGPRVVGITRLPGGYEVLVNFQLKPGAWISPANPWTYPSVFTQYDVNLTTNWGLWWGIGDHARLTTTDGRIVGGAVRLISTTPLNYPIAIGHAWEHDCAGADIYDSNGQLALPHTRGMLVSA